MAPLSNNATAGVLLLAEFSGTSEVLTEMQTSGGEHRVPDLRSGLSGHAQPAESELSFTNPMQQLDAGNRDRRMSAVLQSQHRPQTLLDFVLMELIVLYRCAVGRVLNSLAIKPAPPILLVCSL